MKNKELRDYAKEKAVKLWEIADKLGVCDMTLTRMLRYELPEKKKAQILAIIDEIANEREEEEYA